MVTGGPDPHQRDRAPAQRHRNGGEIVHRGMAYTFPGTASGR